MNVGGLRVLGMQNVEIDPQLRHLEVFTTGGLLTLLWHGPENAREVVLCGGGAMGGLLGPANADKSRRFRLASQFFRGLIYLPRQEY